MSASPTLRNGVPDQIGYNSAAAEVLSAVQDKVYDEHRLVKGRSRRTKTGSRDADDEYERRNETREAYRKLSRYYRLEEGRLAWSAPRLLSKGKHKSRHSASRCFTHSISYSIGRPRDPRGSPGTRCRSNFDSSRLRDLEMARIVLFIHLIIRYCRMRTILHRFSRFSAIHPIDSL